MHKQTVVYTNQWFWVNELPEIPNNSLITIKFNGPTFEWSETSLFGWYFESNKNKKHKNKTYETRKFIDRMFLVTFHLEISEIATLISWKKQQNAG